jgi:Tfp pilus assembly protein PilN
MINLLPPEHAISIRYGRQNAMLRRWLILMLVAIAGLIVLLGFGYAYLAQQTRSLNNDIVDSQQLLKDQKLTQVEKQAQEISNNIKTINQVLGQEIRFSDLIQAIGKIVPPGSVLGSLSLSKVDGALDLTISSKDYNSALLAAANLSDTSNGLFDKVDIINVSCSTGTSDYKCSSTVRVLFSKTAKTKFLNATAGANK